LQISEFVWTLRSSLWVVFNSFLLKAETDRSKISSDQKRLFFAVSLYPFHFSRTLPSSGKIYSDLRWELIFKEIKKKHFQCVRKILKSHKIFDFVVWQNDWAWTRTAIPENSWISRHHLHNHHGLPSICSLHSRFNFNCS